MGLTFDQQPLVSLLPPLSLLLLTLFPLLGWGKVPGRRPLLDRLAPLRPSFRQTLVLGVLGRGWPPQGLFQSETALPGNRGSCPPIRGVTAWAEGVEPHVWLPLAPTHSGPPQRFRDRRLHVSVGASQGMGQYGVGLGLDTGIMTLGRQTGLSTNLKEVHRVGGAQRKGLHPARGSEKEETP